MHDRHALRLRRRLQLERTAYHLLLLVVGGHLRARPVRGGRLLGVGVRAQRILRNEVGRLLWGLLLLL